VRGDQRRQELQCLLGIQSGRVPCDQFERGTQEIICRLDEWAQIDPKKRQENVARFRVWLVYSLAISVSAGVKVKGRLTCTWKGGGQRTALLYRSRVTGRHISPRPYRVVQVFREESLLPRRGRRLGACQASDQHESMWWYR